MTTHAAVTTISALRVGHDRLTAVVQDLPAGAITGPSGATEWSIAQVLSHLGSGAEISAAALRSALDGGAGPAGEPNQQVWDRWNAKQPQQQADDVVTANEALVQLYEGLDDQARSATRINLGFLPAPVDVATAAGLRLNEFALHSWDVAVAGDPAAVVAPEATPILLDILPQLLGWIGRPGSVLDGRTVLLAVRTSDPTRDFGLTIGERVALGDSPHDPDGTLTLPAESWLRLASGRLSAAHTPDTVTLSGAITLEQLRQIFPGY